MKKEEGRYEIYAAWYSPWEAGGWRKLTSLMTQITVIEDLNYAGPGGSRYPTCACVSLAFASSVYGEYTYISSLYLYVYL